VSAILADLRLAIRLARHQPAFTILVVLTLALGVGANTAIFSAVNGLLLRPAPFRDPDRLVRISLLRGDEEGPVAVPELDDIKELPVIEAAALYTDQGMYNASGFGKPEELPATITTHNLFRVLGVEPLIGTTFPAHFDRTRQFGLVISHGLWVRRFGGDPNIVGRTMTLDGSAGYQIFGVMPPEFNFPSASDLFRSSGIDPNPASYQRRDLRNRMMVARLRAGVSLEQARTSIAALARRLEQDYPATNRGAAFKVTSLNELYTGNIRSYVLILFGAVGLVLIISCANVSNLLLSRAIAREREIVVRTALGAPRWSIVRQLLVESLALSGLGALFGLALAVWGVRALTAMVPVELPRWMRVEVDQNGALFLLAVTAIAGVISGIVPALKTGALDLRASLNEGARGSSAGLGQRRLRHGLVVIEVALALVLLVGASLLLQTIYRLQRVPLGFDPANTLTFRVELGWAAYNTPEKTNAFNQRVVNELRALPGVRGVTFDSNLPMSGKPRDARPVRVRGQAAHEAERNPFINLHVVGPDYFHTMGIGLRSGRDFTDDDRPTTTQVAIVSRRLAERLWPGQDAVGRQFQLADTGATDAWVTVAGVSEPVLHHQLDGDPGLDVYRPSAQGPARGPYFVIRSSGDPSMLANAATAIIGETDPNQSFFDVQSFDRRIANRMWQRRLAGSLFGWFAALALVLAAVGLYGVLSQLVAQQTRDIGVRVALGAPRQDILMMVLGRGLALAGIGAGVGLVLAIATARVIAGVLYGVSPSDPLTLIAVTSLLMVVAGLASYVPVLRALRIDPIQALRNE
jgi:putative ABC transport system permease protein